MQYAATATLFPHITFYAFLHRASFQLIIQPNRRIKGNAGILMIILNFLKFSHSKVNPQTVLLYVLGIQSHNFLKIRNITSAAHLPHAGDSWFGRHSASVMKFVLFPFVYCRRAGSYEAHVASLCQLRNNFFSKISHKAQYYQLTLKISTKKEPLISQKSHTL